MQDVDGKCVILNRDYEVLSFNGQTEFEFDPHELCSKFINSAKNKFLMCENGTNYAGTMYYLYDGGLYEDRQFATQLDRLAPLISKLISPIGNAFDKHTYTKKQFEEANEKFARATTY